MPKKPESVQSDVTFPIKIVDSFFSTKTEGKDSPFVRISEVLQNHGVSKMHLREAIAILIGIMSAKFGDPVPMIITEDEGAGALDLLHICLNLVPAN